MEITSRRRYVGYDVQSEISIFNSTRRFLLKAAVGVCAETLKLGCGEPSFAQKIVLYRLELR